MHRKIFLFDNRNANYRRRPDAYGGARTQSNFRGLQQCQGRQGSDLCSANDACTFVVALGTYLLVWNECGMVEYLRKTC